jgi:hypothetical protein
MATIESGARGTETFFSSVGPPATPQRAAGYEDAKAELSRQLVSQGVEQRRAEVVAEATIRRAWANEGRSVFYYADVEHEFLQQLRDAGVDPEGLEATKRRVWMAARATARSHQLPMEEALFFCYSEGIDNKQDFLIAVGVADDEEADAGPDADPDAGYATGSGS